MTERDELPPQGQSGEGAGVDAGAVSSEPSAGGLSPAAPADLSDKLDPVRTGRWPTLVTKVSLVGQKFFYLIDINPKTLRAEALFVKGGRQGSDTQALAHNIAILVSIALQHGATPEDLGRNLKRPQPGENAGWPALLVPELIDAIEPARQTVAESLRSAGLAPQEAAP